MHREHDPHEWTSLTAQLFPKESELPVTEALAPESGGHAHHHSHPPKDGHHHHHEDDPVAIAQAHEARRQFQTRLAQLLGVLILAEALVWFFASPVQFRGWYSPARWAGIIGTIWCCHGVLENLLHGKIGADLALAQAALAALFLGEDFVAAEVVFISLIGEWLEDFAYQRARKAIGGLIDHAPRTARVLRGEKWLEVPAGSVLVGEYVAVEAGEIIPVDGLVAVGRSSVDASSLTGESIPVDVGPDDRVACGQINQFGRLEVRAERVGMESTLGQVVRLMTKAQSKKAHLERMADRYARYFLPAVETAALLTLLAGFLMNWPDRWLRAVAVLVVACPCPLVLATPATVLAGWAVLARRGVMVKNGAALEQLARCDTLAFDKTGTLTIGEPDLVRFEPIAGAVPGIDKETSLASLIIAVERFNPHPLASAIVKGLDGQGTQELRLVQSETFPSAGVVGKVQIITNANTNADLITTDNTNANANLITNDNTNGNIINDNETGTLDVLVGNLRLMMDHRIELDNSTAAFLETCDNNGETPLLVAVGNKVVAHIAMADQVRPEAHDMVHDLKHLGFSETAILTGDRPGAANRVGKKVHIKNVFSQMTAVEKAAWIQDKHVSGRTVAMVGDGINDAPALAVARVGLAVTKVGANLATEAGDIILMHDPLRSLVRARQVSQATVRILKQNIILFAFGLNGLAVLLAGLGVLSPVAAAIFHQIGSLAVLCNALRLLAFDHLQKDAMLHRAEHLLEDIDHALIRLLNRLIGLIPSVRTMAWAIGSLSITAYLLSGLSLVSYDEVLVRFRRGAKPAVIQPGLYVGRPWPFEEIHRIKPRAWWHAALTAQSTAQSNVTEPASSWSGIVNEDKSTLWLTGDDQLLEIEGSLQARPLATDANLTQIVQQNSRPLDRIQAEVEAQLRESIARSTLEELLSEKRDAIVQSATEAAIAKLAQNGLALAELVISLDRVQPPWSVMDAWRDTARADSEADRLDLVTRTTIESENTANLAAIEILGKNATNQAKLRTAQARVDADNFRMLVKARRGFSNLTDHRLFWSTLETILKDRPKLLLDVPAGDLYGTNQAKRHLILPESPVSFGAGAGPSAVMPQPLMNETVPMNKTQSESTDQSNRTAP